MDAMNAYAADYNYDTYPVMPGDSNIFEINITNESGHSYTYKDKSFVLTTADAHEFLQSNALGYDGQLIPNVFTGFVTWTNQSIQELYQTEGNVTVD